MALPLALVLAVTALIAYATLFAARYVRYEVTQDALRIRGDLYGRTIARNRLDLDRSRAVDLNSEPDLRLSIRTNGIGLSGYKSGWFRLKNGEKALVFVTDSTRVAYIPTLDGYSVLVSVVEPGGLLAALRRAR